ncbi:MAG: S46 family peptidase [Saprospiraceae bacterium]|nr:S46 family peptidase [Saprospiraceae bacterium]
MKPIYFLIAFLLTGLHYQSISQKKASQYDLGKMWTFENPPKDWFKETYNLDMKDDWFNSVRKSSLRFASWCSASFISPDGLIMTNHHCSRDVVTVLQKEGENFDKQGFYAENLADERKAEGLFVEQLIQAIDITARVKEVTHKAKNYEEELQLRKKAIEDIQANFREKPEWKDLRLQVVTFYSGGKFSLYGYKKYSDIRLVWIPELDLGFFGGDPDNFTYPRYNLDATFWRAYDENGKPVNSSEHYFKFNKNGAVENEPVFVIGNPGKTERYRTVSQLEFDRDYRYNFRYKYLKNRNDMMMKEYMAMKDDPAKEFEAQELLNTIANVANSMKAFGGISAGLKDPKLFNRKVEMENIIRSKSPGVTYWDDMAKYYQILNPHGWAISDLEPSPYKGNACLAMHQLHRYKEMVANNAPIEEKTKLQESIKELMTTFDTPKEKELFTTLLKEISEDIYPGDMTLKKLLGKKNQEEFVNHLFKRTKFKDVEKLQKFFEKEDKINKEDDVLMEAADILIGRYNEAAKIFSSNSKDRQALEAKIANQVFQVYGDQMPPDATFTLRISDGIMKGYDYNGTKAPVITTYFGLYDRYYSNNKTFPWTLPEKWKNPPLEFLQIPMNCVSTNDIIGGNSGSPLINRNKEIVGLIFDGNIESLPGNFIFDEEYNRTVSVHSGGIYGALKYIYKAERIIKELD